MLLLRLFINLYNKNAKRMKKTKIDLISDK